MKGVNKKRDLNKKLKDKTRSEESGNFFFRATERRRIFSTLELQTDHGTLNNG